MFSNYCSEHGCKKILLPHVLIWYKFLQISLLHCTIKSSFFTFMLNLLSMLSASFLFHLLPVMQQMKNPKFMFECFLRNTTKENKVKLILNSECAGKHVHLQVPKSLVLSPETYNCILKCYYIKFGFIFRFF